LNKEATVLFRCRPAPDCSSTAAKGALPLGRTSSP